MFATTYRQRLTVQKKTGLFRNPPLIEKRDGVYVFIGGRKLLNFSSNDYLGLGDSQILREKTARNFLKYGSSASSSRLVSANYDIMQEAENRYARYFGYDEALFFQSGYQANLAIISTFFGTGDTVIFDKHIHASSIKGIMLSGCHFTGYNHGNMSHLEKRLLKSPQDKTAVLTESLFSMDGDIPDMAAIKKLKKRYLFLCVVDEAHAFGALGTGGRGLAGDIADIALGTFGKALGFFGAFALLPKGFKSYLLNFASPVIYSTSLPAAHAATALDILEIIENSDALRACLAKISRLIKTRLRNEGFTVYGDAHIVAIEIGNEQKTWEISNRLLEKGIFVFSARYPTVPMGKAILRLSMTAGHKPEDIDIFVERFKEVYRNVMVN
jgi:8-amino-7-oxononanoate synthase